LRADRVFAYIIIRCNSLIIHYFSKNIQIKSSKHNLELSFIPFHVNIHNLTHNTNVLTAQGRETLSFKLFIYSKNEVAALHVSV
jgi:hypothetical protein